MKMSITERQPFLTKHFAKLIRENKLVHAYLLSGAEGTGKIELAKWVAKGIFCLNSQNGVPCLKCSECNRIENNNHPDVVTIMPDGLSIKVEQIRYLKSEFNKSGVESDRKVFIIQDAQKMSIGAANSLLKFLEEPSGNITAFLLTSEPQKLLPTIISRCQEVEMQQLTSGQLEQELISESISEKNSHILANLAQSVVEAKKINDNENFDKILATVNNWYRKLLRKDLLSFVMIQSKIIGLIQNKEDQNLVLQVIILTVRDTVLERFGLTEEIVFKENIDFIQQNTAQITNDKLVNGLNLVVESNRKLASNISMQNMLETLTLNLFDCYFNK
ncbi:DNA polymerase III subunit delta' [Ligilactobacillus salivarius]|uniref:DNA polymerase III subunit delta n=4 Tax=Ligilactobacillus salivarius TaxID=1624 RepID=A0A1V9RAP2_9LACO|nr:DNA polymerase III subunit delta' [Ligilactobacillus salivarius]AYC10388.1 DNA polymerase III subunit tau [Ligilactobacillus salivarius]EGL99747.1 DNA polymerase III delta prime subunit [Ligilactobacillus salivarius NIAS840]EIA32149.1 DNA polymerase III subunit delta' [Ligilactobacillus salivarius SMXD51]MBC6926649.1 DNA polymerase III subunit delta' [Ligilactobacillus salivarius]MBD5789668.1 DNA polymerase III subunit delta' [Ligilactobacillus salivarius]